MTKNIAIIGLNGNLVEIYSINLDLIGKNLDDQDFFDEAWKCALEDKKVEPKDREKYSFKVVNQ